MRWLDTAVVPGNKPSQGRGGKLKTKSTGPKTSKFSKSKATVATKKVSKQNVRHTARTKSTVALTAVKGAKSQPLASAKVKSSVVVRKVSVTERITKSKLVKSAAVVTLKSQKTKLTLVKESAGKIPATKISRSEPSSLGSKVITARFGVESVTAKPVLAVKSVERAPAVAPLITEVSNFKAGDKIVYPGHGVGEIEGIRTTVLGGQEHHIYNIKILESGMKVMVPVSQASAVGLRKIIDKKAIDEVFSILKDRDFKIDTQTWNRRFREYSQKIKTGSVFEIAVVLRDLSVLSSDKELSFGEKKMLDMAESLLVSEIAIAKARPHDKVVGELRALFA